MSGIYVFARGEAIGGRAWTGFYCLAARTTTSRLRTPFILEVVMYEPYQGLVLAQLANTANTSETKCVVLDVLAVLARANTANTSNTTHLVSLVLAVLAS